MKPLLPVVAGLLAAATLSAQTPDVTLWVTLGDSDQLVAVDPYSFRELRRIKVDPRPHGLAISADGSKVYLASDQTGNFQVVDARTGRITGQVRVGTDPNQMTLTRDGRFAYVPIRASTRSPSWSWSRSGWSRRCPRSPDRTTPTPRPTAPGSTSEPSSATRSR